MYLYGAQSPLTFIPIPLPHLGASYSRDHRRCGQSDEPKFVQHKGILHVSHVIHTCFWVSSCSPAQVRDAQDRFARLKTQNDSWEQEMNQLRQQVDRVRENVSTAREGMKGYEVLLFSFCCLFDRCYLCFVRQEFKREASKKAQKYAEEDDNLCRSEDELQVQEKKLSADRNSQLPFASISCMRWGLYTCRREMMNTANKTIIHVPSSMSVVPCCHVTETQALSSIQVRVAQLIYIHRCSDPFLD